MQKLDSDRSAWPIFGANVGTIVIAIWQDWGLIHLLWPFWIQSVIIGVFARKRMLVLKDFCVEGFKVNNVTPEATPKTARNTANFFAIHYGIFHLGYLVFLLTFTSTVDSAGYIEVTNSNTGKVSSVYIGIVHSIDLLYFAGIGISFWFSHRASSREHIRKDLKRKPNLGSLMMLPYARIIPMHLTLIFGLILGGKGASVVLFGSLKAGADILMHKVEHRWLQKEQRET